MDICLSQQRLVGWIKAGGICLKVGELSKVLKRVWNRTEGREHKDLKKGVNMSQRVGSLKKGVGTLLKTMLQHQIITRVEKKLN